MGVCIYDYINYIIYLFGISIGDNRMILTNIEAVPGLKIAGIYGVVSGSTVRAKHIGKDLMAGIKNTFGGELKGYTELLEESRKEATQYIKSFDMREILGFSNQPLNSAFSSLFYQDTHPSDYFYRRVPAILSSILHTIYLHISNILCALNNVLSV